MERLSEAELEAKHPRWFRHMVKMIERHVPEIGKRPRRKVKPRGKRKKKRRKSRKKKQNLLDMVLQDLKRNVAPPGYKRLGGATKRVRWREALVPQDVADEKQPI